MVAGDELAAVTAVTEGEDMEQLQAAMIDILIPVLGRPHNAGPLVQNIRDTTEAAVTINFVCSRNDHDDIDACEATGETVLIMDWPAGRGDYAKKINAGELITDTANGGD